MDKYILYVPQLPAVPVPLHPSGMQLGGNGGKYLTVYTGYVYSSYICHSLSSLSPPKLL